MKRKILISVSALALVSGVVFGSGYAVKPLATQFIRQNGFPEASLSSLSFTPTGLFIEHIALDKNDFSSVDNVSIGFQWFDFLKSRKIESLTIKDISLTCELDEAGHFKIAGWDATLPEGDSSSSLIPIQSLLLQGVTLDIETTQGDIRVQGKLSLDTSSNDTQTVQYAIWGQQHQISFDTTGTGKLSANGAMSFSTTINDGRINLDGLELSRASGWLDYSRADSQAVPAYSGQLVAGKVNTLGALLQNVTVTLDTTKEEALFFKTSPAGHSDISVTGRWITSPKNELELIVDSQSAHELVELISPDNAKTMQPWLKNANPLSLSLFMPIESLRDNKKDASYKLQLGNKGSAVTLYSSGHAIYDAETAISHLQIDKTNISIAGGNISLSPFNLSTDYDGKKPLDIMLTLQSIQMDELAKLSDIKGLKASGTLSGTVPVSYSDKGLIFGQGLIQSDGKGVFSYIPDNFPPALQGDDERMQTVRDVLSDFHFTVLSAEVSGPFSSKMKTTLKAEGINPAFGERPIKLNLNLDGDLGGVIQQTLQAGDIGSKIGSQISGAKK